MAQKINLLDKKYILKPGKVLYYNHTHFNNDTLTDRMAENAVKKFPALINAFLSERERAILEAKAKAHHDIGEAEDSEKDLHNEEQVIVLIDAQKFDEAREVAEKILVDETREAALEAIDEGEEKIKTAAEEAEKVRLAGIQAQKDAEAKEVKRLIDEKAKAEQEAKDKEAKALKAEAEKKRKAAAKKKEEDAKPKGLGKQE